MTHAEVFVGDREFQMIVSRVECDAGRIYCHLFQVKRCALFPGFRVQDYLVQLTLYCRVTYTGRLEVYVRGRTNRFIAIEDWQ